MMQSIIALFENKTFDTNVAGIIASVLAVWGINLSPTGDAILVMAIMGVANLLAEHWTSPSGLFVKNALTHWRAGDVRVPTPVKKAMMIVALMGLGMSLSTCGPSLPPQPPVPPPSPISTAPAAHPSLSPRLQAILTPQKTGDALGDLQTYITKLLDYVNGTDLPAALADANAQTPPDVVAAQCYSGLKNNVAPLAYKLLALIKLPPNGGVTNGGLIYEFQRARDLKNAVGPLTSQGVALLGQIRVQLNVSCAALFIDSNASVVDPLSLFTGNGPTQ